MIAILRWHSLCLYKALHSSPSITYRCPCSALWPHLSNEDDHTTHGRVHVKRPQLNIFVKQLLSTRGLRMTVSSLLGDVEWS